MTFGGAEQRPGLGPRPQAQRNARTRPAGRFPWTLLAVLAGLACIAMYAWGWLVSTSAVGVALIAVPFLLLISAPIFVRAANDEQGFDLGGLLALGLVVRLAAAYYRYTNAADGATYHLAGSELAKSYRRLDFSADPVFPVPGTGGMRIIAGVVEVFTNGNSIATFLVFSWLGFLGCYFCYRALVTALPGADRHRYALLVMFWPTLVLWPSSIGKDCWLLFSLGIAAMGAARVLVRGRGGFTLLVLGLLAGSLVRPHMSLMFAIAFGVALLVGRRAERPGSMTPTGVAKVAGLVVLLVLGGYLVTRTGHLLNTSDLQGGIDTALEQNSSRTALGGSAFSAPDPRNPIGYVEASVTILFRPFPFETHNLESTVSSLEGLALLALGAFSVRRLATIPRRLRAEPYVTLALAYSLMFFFAFGTISNFGILARQRSMLMPFLFVLLSLATVPKPRATPKPPTASPRVRRAPTSR